MALLYYHLDNSVTFRSVYTAYNPTYSFLRGLRPRHPVLFDPLKNRRLRRAFMNKELSVGVRFVSVDLLYIYTINIKINIQKP